MRTLALLSLSLCCCGLTANVAADTPKPPAVASAKPSAAQAEGLVKKAIAYGKKFGAEKLIAETNQGVFHVGTGGELYVSIYDEAGVIRAIGFNGKALIGQNGMTLKDKGPSGKLFFKEIITQAKAKGSGWIDYIWTHPVTNQPAPKTAYYEAWDGLVLTVGVYK